MRKRYEFLKQALSLICQPISLQSVGVNLWYFKLRLYSLTGPNSMDLSYVAELSTADLNYNHHFKLNTQEEF